MIWETNEIKTHIPYQTKDIWRYRSSSLWSPYPRVLVLLREMGWVVHHKQLVAISVDYDVQQPWVYHLSHHPVFRTLSLLVCRQAFFIIKKTPIKELRDINSIFNLSIVVQIKLSKVWQLPKISTKTFLW